MRLEGRVKLGYYPTSTVVADQIKTALTWSAGATALDPSCGTGTALAHITRSTGATTYGIEPDKPRCTEASTRLTNVINCGIEESRISHNSVSFLFLNPPYDTQSQGTDERRKRIELAHLQRALPWLIDHGVMTWIVPRHVLTDAVRNWLDTRFIGLTAWHYTDSPYDQIIIMGIRDKSAVPTPWSVTESTFPPAGITYHVPAAPQGEIETFRTTRIDSVMAMELAAKSTLWERLIASSAKSRETGRPPKPLGRGHTALLLAAGALDGIIGNGSRAHVVRGAAVKGKSISGSESTDDDGRTVNVTVARDTYHVSLRIATAAGIVELT